MGLGDVFKASENKQLKDRIVELEAMLTPEMRNVDTLRREISRLESEKAAKTQELNNYNRQLAQVSGELTQKRSQCAYLDEEIMFESFGLYTPRFNFAKAEQYKAQLDSIRQRQKAMIAGNTSTAPTSGQFSKSFRMRNLYVRAGRGIPSVGNWLIILELRRTMFAARLRFTARWGMNSTKGVQINERLNIVYNYCSRFGSIF